jgi:hypothetical protein
MQLAIGFWGSKVLLSAVEIGVFGAFDDGPLNEDALRTSLGLHRRAARDFFDALVALGLLERDDTGRYSNSEESELFLNPARPGYIGALIEMMNARLYGFWARSLRRCVLASRRTRRSTAAICSVHCIPIRSGWRVFFAV